VHCRLLPAALGAASAVVLAASPSASAQPTVRQKPFAWLTMPARGDAGGAITAHFNAGGFARGDRLLLQRVQGTARKWVTVRSLGRRTRGDVSLSLPPGAYDFRLIIRSARKRTRAADTATVRVFGRVALGTMLNGTPESIYTTPTGTFAWVAAEQAFPDESRTALTVAVNYCRTAHISFVPGDFLSGYTGPGTAAIVQVSRDPVSVTAARYTVGEVTAPLTPGQAWSVNVTGDRTMIYLNGWAECYRVGAASTR
jgi:hypothetical protein